MTRTNYNSRFVELAGARPIVFNPALAKIAGSATAGLFMSQLLYWWTKGKYVGWVFKTMEEVKQETYLTRSEQDCAIERWERLGVLEKQLMGLPRKRYFRIDLLKLESLLKGECRLTEAQTAARKPAKNDKQADRSEHAITESTPESTSKNTNRNSVLQTVDSVKKEIEAKRKELTKKLSLPHDYHG